MPDWRALVRARLVGAGLHPTAELDVIEELAQHVEDRYRALRSEGVAEADAADLSLCELAGHDLIAGLLESLPRE